MTDNKLTYEQVIPRLIHEVELAEEFGDVHSMMIQIGLIKDTLDLVKRQKAEIGRLEFIATRSESRHQTSESDRRYACGVLWDSLEKETENNRKLQADVDFYKERANKYEAQVEVLKEQTHQQKAEIERLRHILVNFMGEIFEWGNKNDVDTRIFAQIAILDKEKDEAVKQIKAEAIKEFAERLKKKAGIFQYHYKGLIKAVRVEKIDNLVNEMVGEG